MSNEVHSEHTLHPSVGGLWLRVRQALFGDRIGYTLFLASLAFFVLYWRIGVVINDNYTVANTLVALERGQLHLTDPVYFGSFDTPGTHYVDGRIYGRNYGQVFLALPFLWVLRGLAEVVYLSVGISAAWSLLLLGLTRNVGHHLGRPREAAIGGSVLALVTFAVGLLTAHPIAPDRLPLMALQISTIVVTALAAVFCYRLFAGLYSRRVGLAAGVAYAAVLPTSFWASIPKRHALTTALLVVSIYFLYRSRGDEAHPLRSRALAYVPVGLTAWVHAPEGFLLLVGVGVADVLTAERNDLRSLATVGAVLFVSLVPFFLTNYLIAGNPVEPPRFTPSLKHVTAAAEAGTSGGSSADASSAGILGSVLARGLDFFGQFVEGARVFVFEPGRVVDTYLFSQGFRASDQNMAILESAPVLGALAGGAVLAVRHRFHGLVDRTSRPKAALSLFVLVYGVLLALVYMPTLPLHAQITVRYLLPLFPLAIVGLLAIPSVRGLVEDHGQTLAWTYASGTLIGTQLFLAAIVLLDALLREAMQLGAFMNLGLAGLLGAWTVASAFGYDSERFGTLGAILLGLAAAAGTAFVLVSSWYYFPYGPFALPFVPRP